MLIFSLTIICLFRLSICGNHQVVSNTISLHVSKNKNESPDNRISSFPPESISQIVVFSSTETTDPSPIILFGGTYYSEDLSSCQIIIGHLSDTEEIKWTKLFYVPGPNSCTTFTSMKTQKQSGQVIITGTNQQHILDIGIVSTCLVLKIEPTGKLISSFISTSRSHFRDTSCLIEDYRDSILLIQNNVIEKHQSLFSLLLLDPENLKSSSKHEIKVHQSFVLSNLLLDPKTNYLYFISQAEHGILFGVTSIPQKDDRFGWSVEFFNIYSYDGQVIPHGIQLDPSDEGIIISGGTTDTSRNYFIMKLHSSKIIWSNSYHIPNSESTEMSPKYKIHQPPLSNLKIHNEKSLFYTSTYSKPPKRTFIFSSQIDLSNGEILSSFEINEVQGTLFSSYFGHPSHLFILSSKKNEKDSSSKIDISRSSIFHLNENKKNSLGIYSVPKHFQYFASLPMNNGTNFTCSGKKPSDPTVCSGRGACISQDHCNCTTGYTGADCSTWSCQGIDKSAKTVCAGHGNCTSPDHCECITGYLEPKCDDWQCYGIGKSSGSVCSSHGTCDSPNVCKCAKHYSESKCDSWECFSIKKSLSSVCSSHGSCNDYDTCKCDPNYTGKDCSGWKCGNYEHTESEKRYCSKRGDCIGFNHCQCNHGFYGESCEFFKCHGVLSNESNVCSGHGSCKYNGVNTYCKCTSDYYSNYGTVSNCAWWECNNIKKGDTRVCGEKGVCVDKDKCECNHGYFGQYCNDWQCFKKDHTAYGQVCSGHGVCVSPDFCKCEDDYHWKPDCSMCSCGGYAQNDSKVCTGHGICSRNDWCDCETGYYPHNMPYKQLPHIAYCNQWNCFNKGHEVKDVCSSNGVCIGYDNCSCNGGYYGKECDDWSCYGVEKEKACSGNGKCLAPDKCQCNSGFYSNDCSKWTCFGIKEENKYVCGGHGKCVGLDTCQCEKGYEITKNCSVWDCFGVNNTNPKVCTGHGNCIDFDYCECDSHYTKSKKCDFWTCNKIENNDTNVCSNHGGCSSFDYCDCKGGYYSYPKGVRWDNCDGYSCFGVSSKLPESCSGSQGTCIGPDICRCDVDLKTGKYMYTGKKCEINICFGIKGTDHAVCSGHGGCSAYNKCQCMSGFTPTKCSLTTCYGIQHNDTKVCGGRGQCVSFDNCDCETGSIYSGSQCDSLRQFSIVFGLSLGAVLVVCFLCVFLVLFGCICCVCCICFFGLSSTVVTFLCTCSCSSIGCCGWLTNRIEKARKMKIEDYLRRSKNKRSGIGFLTMSFDYSGTFLEEKMTEEFEGNPDGEGVIFGVFENSRFIIFEGLFKDGKKEGKGIEFFPPDDTYFEKKLRANKKEKKKKKKKKKKKEKKEKKPDYQKYDDSESSEEEPIERIRTHKKFEGHYMNNLRHGKGIEYSRQGKSFEGVWEKGESVRIERGFVDLEVVELSSFRYNSSRDKIGFGAEGDVFKVEYKGIECALKVLRRRAVNQQNALLDMVLKKNFVRSQMIWSKIHTHPNILGLYCWSGINSDDLGYCMQRCDYSLSDVIKNGLVGWKFKLSVLYEICIAMEYLHNLSIMHRDLKPENILIDEFDHPQICDFEFARYDDLDWRLVVSNKSVLGTPTFVAPEVIGGKHYSKKCDVFSFGIIVYCVYYDVVNPYKDVKECDVCNTAVSPHEIVTHVTRCGLRPPIWKNKKDLLQEFDWMIHEVMKICVEPDPRKRTTFSKLVQLFRQKIKKKKKKKKKKKRGSKNKAEMDFSEKTPFLSETGIN